MKGKTRPMLIRRFIELLTPESCLSCGIGGVVFCTTCRRQARVERGLDRAAECYRCGRETRSGETCTVCLSHSRLDGVAVASYYAGPVQELILRLKFHRLQAAAEVAAEMVAEVVPREWGVGLVTSVPISRRPRTSPSQATPSPPLTCGGNSQPNMRTRIRRVRDSRRGSGPSGLNPLRAGACTRRARSRPRSTPGRSIPEERAADPRRSTPR